MQILLIEDNVADASLIKDLFYLKFEKGSIDWVTSLEQGFEKLANDKYNLIILDLGLPDSDGINTFHTLKSHTRIPIVKPSRAKAEPIRPKLASGRCIRRKYWLVIVTIIRRI